MKIISHRGGAKIAPENSIEAIRLSRELGVDAIEIDVRPTKDKKLVLFHDRTLRRLAWTNKSISQLTLEEVKKIKLRNGASIPTLDEAIAEAGNTPLLIEGKQTGWAKLLVDALKDYRHKDSLRVISFNDKELANFHNLAGDIRCYAVGIINGFKAIARAKKYGYEGVDFFFAGLNPITYKMAKERGLKIIIYTPNSIFLSKLLLRLYPDIELTTDRPDILLKAKAQR